MLTIFEYLRKLARESVLSGVQDAVEYLGGKTGGSQRSVEDHSPTNSDAVPPVPPRFNPQNYLAGPGPAPNGPPDDLPPPRRRGRPPKSGESA